VWEKSHTFVILIGMEHPKRVKNIKITPKTHNILKSYCDKNALKMFAFVEKLIMDKCKPKPDIYGDS